MFGLAVGFVFFGRPEIAFLIGLGALVPDLDREYWFIPSKLYADEQIHRASPNRGRLSHVILRARGTRAGL